MQEDAPTKRAKPEVEETKAEVTSSIYSSIELGTTHPPESIDMLLAHSWEDKNDPKGWWMSEKLDGVRCYWNGTSFLSRNAKKYDVPAFFIEHLPKTVSLDGELWMDRKKFQQTISIVRR
jgi:DNA ligase-1